MVESLRLNFFGSEYSKVSQCPKNLGLLRYLTSIQGPLAAQSRDEPEPYSFPANIIT